jgi:hypothetical protein
VDYQFPDAVDPRQRRSWLVIEGAAYCPQGTWSFRWQALTPDDAVVLANWLRRTADRPTTAEPDSASLTFTEPNLSFSFTRTDAHRIDLDVGLDLEFSPPWRRHTRAGDPFVISCQLTPESVMTAATDWAAEISAYPP